MARNRIVIGFVVGAVTALPLMAVMYFGEQLAQLPFLPFDFFDWMARVLPGNVITVGIDAIVRIIQGFQLGATGTSAKLIEQVMAIGIVIGMGGVLGGIIAALRGRFPISDVQLGTAVAVIAFFPLFMISASQSIAGDWTIAFLWTLLLFVGWGATMGWGIGKLTPATDTVPATTVDTSRRSVLTRLIGGSAILSILGVSIGRYLQGTSTSSGAGQTLVVPTPAPVVAPTGVAVAPTAAGDGGAATPVPDATAGTGASDGRIAPAPGTRDELTSNENFYRIDINTRPPVIQENAWTLQMAGQFDNARDLSLADLMAYPAVTQPITIGCISNRVGGDLISTSNWTGVPIATVLQDLGIRSVAQYLYIEGVDGFYETVSYDDFMDPRTLLVYAMNGETLPVEHGFPLRIYIPNRYGMKQPKWITRIEATPNLEPGYWVVRGWSQEARPQIASVIDTIATGDAQDGVVPVGGIAWAGDRTITKVEVQVDSEEWQPAELRIPTISPLTWTQWRYDWKAAPGNHTLRVRATDGKGDVQIQQEQGVRPDGATGYHTRTVTV